MQCNTRTFITFMLLSRRWSYLRDRIAQSLFSVKDSPDHYFIRIRCTEFISKSTLVRQIWILSASAFLHLRAMPSPAKSRFHTKSVRDRWFPLISQAIKEEETAEGTHLSEWRTKRQWSWSLYSSPSGHVFRFLAAIVSEDFRSRRYKYRPESPQWYSQSSDPESSHANAESITISIPSNCLISIASVCLAVGRRVTVTYWH